MAFSDLTLAIKTDGDTGKVALDIFQGSKTADYEMGNAGLTWKRLVDNYEPKAQATEQKLTSDFYSMKLKKGEDPSTFITEMQN